MSKKYVLGLMAAVTVTQSSSTALADRETAGGIIGAIIGGVVGNQVGSGSGRAAATVIGAIIGSAVGSSVGRDMDEADRRALADAQRRCFQSPVNTPQRWDGATYGSRRGYRGEFTSTREGYNQRTGETCREYSSTIYYNNRTESNKGIACTRRDGSYYEVNSSEVSWGGNGGYAGGVNGGNQPPRYPDHGGRDGGRDGGRGRGRDGGWERGPRGPRAFRSEVIVPGISRNSGGSWVRVVTGLPVRMDSIEIQALNGGVRVYEAVVHTEFGRRYSVWSLASGQVLYGGQVVYSENLSHIERITAVDLRMESFGGYNDARVVVNSLDGHANLRVLR